MNDTILIIIAVVTAPLIILAPFAILRVAYAARISANTPHIAELDIRSVRSTRTYDRILGVAVTLFLMGTLTWRIRTSEQLVEDAVDGAALTRLVFDGLALILAIAVALNTSRPPRETRVLSPARFFAAYIVAVAVGALFAISPGLTLFRVGELVIVGLLVTLTARRYSFVRVLHLCQNIMFFYVALLLLGIIVGQEAAFPAARGGIVPFRLEGAFPLISFNSVGAIGTALFALGLGVDRLKRLSILLGLSLILLAQYRTGYVAVAAVLLVWLLTRKSPMMKLLGLLTVPAVYLFTQTSLFSEAWERGESDSRSSETLSGRTEIWSLAIGATERSPIFGTGLSPGLRFEVAPFFSNTEVSTAHGTWVEAYLGTGWVGTTLLAITAAVGIAACWRVRSVSIAPVLLAAMITVRGLTGTTIELPGWTQLIFLLVAVASFEHLRINADATQAAQVNWSPRGRNVAPSHFGSG